MRAPCSHLRISVTAPVEPSHPTCSGTYVSNSFQESPAPVSGKCVPLLPTCSRSSKSQMSFAASSPTRSASTGVPERASVGLRTFRAHQTDGERRLTYSSSPCSERDTYGLRSCHQDPWPWLRVLWPHKVTLRGSTGHAHPWRTSLVCSELAPCCGHDFDSVELYVKRSRGISELRSTVVEKQRSTRPRRVLKSAFPKITRFCGRMTYVTRVVLIEYVRDYRTTVLRKTYAQM